MPNHVHVILSPYKGVELGKIVKQIKGSSARAINLARGSAGALWHPDYLDKLIRDEQAYDKIRLYIEWNPVKAGLCHEPDRWPYSSASERAQELLAEPESIAGVKD